MKKKSCEIFSFVTNTYTEYILCEQNIKYNLGIEQKMYKWSCQISVMWKICEMDDVEFSFVQGKATKSALKHIF